ncbi:hypothetical protein JXB41_01350 [Candidatus Woesearchaeota archaeon]|nr:hypothetical protein [Candidatus Woesearchaeota archaeon]
MIKKFFSVIVLMLFLISCNTDNRSTSSGIDQEYRKGTAGLIMEFMPELPPSTVYNTYPLSVMIQYRNTGASAITKGIIYLSGYDSRYIDLQSTSSGNSQWVISDLEGKSIYNPEGLYSEIAEFNAARIDVSNIQDIDSFVQAIRATACYDYETKAFPMVCIDPTLGKGTVNENICNINSVSLNGGQGAPVAITRVDQEMAAGRDNRAKVIFKITVKNMGKGTPFNNREMGISNCHSELTFKDIDVINVDRVSFSRYPELNCKPENIKLEKGEGFTICTGEGDYGRNAFTTPLNIELSYGYRDSIETVVKIVNID